MTIRIATWNMQGAAGQEGNKWTQGIRDKLFGQFQVQVVCAQECGGVPADVQSDGWFQYRNPLRQWGNVMSYSWRAGRRTLYVTHLENNGRHPFAAALGISREEARRFRCNLAIVSEERPSRVVQVWSTGRAVHRPAVGAQFTFGWVFSVHAMSGSGNDGPGLVRAAMGTAGAHDWIAGGDFNCHPTKSKPAQEIGRFHHVLSSGNITRPNAGGDSELDYFVARRYAPRPWAEEPCMSDHIAILVDYF